MVGFRASLRLGHPNQAYRNQGLKGSFREDIDIIDVEVDIDIDIDGYFVCLEGVSQSVQLLLAGTEAVLVLTLIILK